MSELKATKDRVIIISQFEDESGHVWFEWEVAICRVVDGAEKRYFSGGGGVERNLTTQDEAVVKAYQYIVAELAEALNKFSNSIAARIH